jgi:hypothetical protein
MDYAKTTRRVSFRPALLSIFTVVTVFGGDLYAADVEVQADDPVITAVACLKPPITLEGPTFDCYKKNGKTPYRPPCNGQGCKVGDSTTDKTCTSIRENYCKEVKIDGCKKPKLRGTGCEQLKGLLFNRTEDGQEFTCQFVKPAEEQHCECDATSASADIDLSELPASN